MSRERIIALVLGLVTILVMIFAGYATKAGWIDTATGLAAIGALGVFLMTIRSWMKEPYPRPKDGDGPNVAGVVLAIAVGSVIASTPYALCGCSADKPIVKANPEGANKILDNSIAERKCVRDNTTEAAADDCIAKLHDGGK